MLVAALAAAASVVISVTFAIYDPDLWQHLLVGRVIASTHAVPHTNLWTWPTYGAPDIDYAWAFEALLWAFWKAGTVTGLFVWRWGLTLAVFGVAWATARRMGARGTSALVMVALGALVYRGRSMPRPENIAALLLAAALWVLVSRRRAETHDETAEPATAAGRPDWLLVPIALLWTNVHLSWTLMFGVAGAFLLDAHLRPRAHAIRATRLWMACALAALALFINPFGARGVWVPIDFMLHGRTEPLFRTIGELQPVDWSVNWRCGLPLIVGGWPLLALRRLIRGRGDPAELVLCGAFVTATVMNQRFMGPLAIVAVPFMARDLSELRWPGALQALFRTSAARGLAAAVACLAIGVPDWSRSAVGVGVGLDTSHQPVAACDFMAAEGVRGHGFNAFYHGGYLLWRFWPDRTRLPFMDIHQTGTRRDRDFVAAVQAGGAAWHAFDGIHHFDYVLLPRDPSERTPLLDTMDSDSTTWACVFLDDAAGLYVRRAGPLGALAARFEYLLLPGGNGALGRIGPRTATDSLLRRAVTRELDREIAASPRHAAALGLLANIALTEGRWDDARSALRQALAIQRLQPRVHERLGIIALQRGEPREALREFETEWRLQGWGHGFDLRRGQVWQAQGDLRRARDAYAREVRRSPLLTEARDSLEAVTARLSR
jgi:tetratricopeptide repeat protein